MTPDAEGVLTGPFAGTVWRILPATAASQACEAVPSPEGRFHHHGQTALYASLSPRERGWRSDATSVPTIRRG